MCEIDLQKDSHNNFPTKIFKIQNTNYFFSWFYMNIVESFKDHNKIQFHQ